MKVKRIFLSFFISLFLLSTMLFADIKSDTNQTFFINLPDDWMELSMPLQNVVASYGKKGTLATFHIIEREMEQTKSISDIKWEDLFSPQFKDIDIKKQGETTVGGERAKYCLYTLHEGNFKNVMEGGFSGKYMNYVLIHKGLLYSITFKDLKEAFVLNYADFLKIIQTLKFEA